MRSLARKTSARPSDYKLEYQTQSKLHFAFWLADVKPRGWLGDKV